MIVCVLFVFGALVGMPRFPFLHSWYLYQDIVQEMEQFCFRVRRDPVADEDEGFHSPGVIIVPATPFQLSQLIKW